MAELAAVIAEHTLDNNAENWFKLPWRNGWNAVELAMHAAVYENGIFDASWLGDVCKKRLNNQDVYWSAQDRLSTTETPNRMMRGAIRCLQVLIAKSDGGGEVYNSILIERFSALMSEQVSELVLEHRCRDSIGVSAVLRGDVNDRLRRAFSTAWKRGLYLASYSLPSAVVKKLAVVK